MLQACVFSVAPAQMTSLISRPVPRSATIQWGGWRPAAVAASSSRRRRCQQLGRLPAATGEAPTAELTLEQLQAGLEEAVKAEDYASAARIRDRINVRAVGQQFTRSVHACKPQLAAWVLLSQPASTYAGPCMCRRTPLQ